jgi:hypothetical protein
MRLRDLPLPLLLAAWPSLALAFPPCTDGPFRLRVVGEVPATPAPAASQAWYELVGDTEVVQALQPPPMEPDAGLPGTGTCRRDDEIPLPGGHLASTFVGIPASYAVRSGHGLIALPDLRGEPGGTAAGHGLRFVVVNVPLPAPGDWIDVAELALHWNDWPLITPHPATLYRIRVLRPAAGPQQVQIIESRRSTNLNELETPMTEQIVATFPLGAEWSRTPISLHWFQVVHSVPIMGVEYLDGAGASPDAGMVDGTALTADVPTHKSYVNTQFAIAGPDGAFAYSVELPGQWANSLSIGLLNYHAPSLSASAWVAGARLEDVRLGTEQ